MTKIAFVFPGQGAQYVGMGKEFFQHFEVADEIFERATQTLGFDMKKLCLEGPEEELKRTENTQPAILTTSIATFEVLIQHGIKPNVMAGLSLGEYSALVASEAIEFDEAVYLVKLRGKFMQEEVPIGEGTMAAFIGLERSKVVEACKKASSYGIVEPANYNSPIQIVISGNVKAVEKAVEFGKELGAKKAIILPVSAPFHSSLLVGAGEKLKRELSKICISDLKYPVISNVTGDYYSSKEEIIRLLVNQVSKPVLWEETIKKMVDDGVDTFVEVGPGKALSGFIKRISRDVNILNVEDMESLEKTIKLLT